MFRSNVMILSLLSSIAFFIKNSDASPVLTSSICTESEFQCKDGNACISIDWICDYSFDCRDKSDEADCPEREATTINSIREPCKEDEFQCASDGICISSSWVCDKAIDCIDNSDEENCITDCMPSEIRCKTTGGCIKEEFICDGEKDCEDNSDEENCPNIHLSTVQPEILTTDTPKEVTEEGDDAISLFITSDEKLAKVLLSKNDSISKNVVEKDENPDVTVPSTDENYSTIVADSDYVEILNKSFSGSLRNPSNDSNETLISANFTNDAIYDNDEFEMPSEIDLNYFLPVDKSQSLPVDLFNEGGEYVTTDENKEYFETSTPKDSESQSTTIDSIVTQEADNDFHDVTRSEEVEYTFEESSTTEGPSTILSSAEPSSLITTIFTTTTPTTTTPTTTTPTTTTPTTTTPTTTTPTTTTPTTTTTTTTPTTTTATTTTTTTTPTTTTTTTPYPCGRGEFLCWHDRTCIPVEWRCDHTADCWDGSDEQHCDQVYCPPEMVQCADTGQCIFHAWICDGSNDCDTGSDELYCY